LDQKKKEKEREKRGAWIKISENEVVFIGYRVVAVGLVVLFY